ncbi:DsbA family oxidoreductase [soil metagenome]
MTQHTITIDLYADIACPWCYLGEARLQRALAARPDLKVTETWRPFQLQPQLPPAGLPWRGFAEKKFGGWERARGMFGQLISLGHAEGLAFDFEDIAKANNTADAHRLILLAENEGQGLAAADALFKAYFENGEDLNSEAALLAVAERVGLEPTKVQRYRESDVGRAEVAASQQRAAQLGISGVPFYVFNDAYGVSGAQPVEVFLEVFEQLANQKEANV